MDFCCLAFLVLHVYQLSTQTTNCKTDMGPALVESDKPEPGAASVAEQLGDPGQATAPPRASPWGSGGVYAARGTPVGVLRNPLFLAPLSPSVSFSLPPSLVPWGRS